MKCAPSAVSRSAAFQAAGFSFRTCSGRALVPAPCLCRGRLPRRTPSLTHTLISTLATIPPSPLCFLCTNSLSPIKSISYRKFPVTTNEMYLLRKTPQGVALPILSSPPSTKSIAPTHNSHKKDNLCAINQTPLRNANTAPKTANNAKCPLQ
jgi:hypothetical protein